MSNDAQALLQQDTETHKERTWLYWAVTAPLSTVMVSAYPPTRAVGAGAGWAIAAVLTVICAAYVVRLCRARARLSDLEVAVGTIAGLIMTAVIQWLCGGFAAPIGILYASQVFGASAVLTDRMRAIHLGLIVIAVLAPAAYGPVSGPSLVTACVWVILLAVEAGFLHEYSVRLRAHRLALLQAERHACARALTDELTGLRNRRALEDDIAGAQARVLAGQPMTVAYLDLDGFKAYNDHFGHAAGDSLLARLGAILRDRVAGHGCAYRIGGDEFCALLAGEYRFGHPLLTAIASGLTERGRDYAITPSCGSVVVPDEAADIRLALQMADARMYDAKRGLTVRAA